MKPRALHNISGWIASFIVSFVYLLYFSTSLSPLFDYSGGDSGIFLTFGDFWLNGGVIYKDLFDNKGPYLFAIQALGMFICPGKWGVFILEVINLTVCLQLLYRIGLIISKKKAHTIFCVLLYLAFLPFLIFQGNTVESWSMPFVLLPIYLYFKKQFIQKNIGGGGRLRWFVYGICFGIVSFMRINNCAPIVGIIMTESAAAIWHKEFKPLFINGLYALTGIILASAPIVIYFYFNEALYDMLYATFLYNIKYKAVWHNYGMKSVITNSFMMSPMLFAILTSVLYDLKNHANTILLTAAMALVLFLTFIDGASYAHYFMITLPVIFLGFAYSYSLPIVLRLAIIFITAGVYYSQYYSGYMIYYFLNREKIETSVEKPEITLARFGRIADSELDSIYILYPLGRQCDFLYTIGRRPVGKYFTQQNDIVKVDPEYLMNDIAKHFEEAKPIWVIGQNKIADSPLSKFTDNYTLIDSVIVNTEYYEQNCYFHKRKDLCQTGQ